MLKQQRTKMSRHRGSSSHGWGHKKKHRGAGHRGGKGLSGTGARGDAQKAGLMSGSRNFLKKMAAGKGVKLKTLKHGNNYFGKTGFTSIHKRKINTLSITFIEENFDKLVENEVIVKEKSDFVFDSTLHGYDKILGRGKFTKKLTIICNEISANALQTLESAGSTVKVLKAKEEAEAKEASKE
jgi:large subunit ribosomal protein L15